jgi:hypothetical protein
MVVEGHSCRNNISVAVRNDSCEAIQGPEIRVVLLRKRQRDSEMLGNGQSEAYLQFPIRELLPVGPSYRCTPTTGHCISLQSLISDTSQRFDGLAFCLL